MVRASKLPTTNSGHPECISTDSSKEVPVYSNLNPQSADKWKFSIVDTVTQNAKRQRMPWGAAL